MKLKRVHAEKRINSTNQSKAGKTNNHAQAIIITSKHRFHSKWEVMKFITTADTSMPGKTGILDIIDIVKNLKIIVLKRGEIC